jgi:hypothetical protein
LIKLVTNKICIYNKRGLVNLVVYPTEEVHPATVEVQPAKEEFLPVKEEFLPAKEEVLPSTVEVLPTTEEVLPPDISDFVTELESASPVSMAPSQSGKSIGAKPGKRLGELRVTDLKRELDLRGLSTSGYKVFLVERLRAATVAEGKNPNDDIFTDCVN